MQTFTDRHGRTWEVEITVGDLKRLKAEAGVDLATLADDGFSHLERVLADPVTVVAALYVLCEDQLKAADLPPDQFGRCFSGDSLEAATKALCWAIVDFFPNPRQRGALRKIVEKSETMRNLAADRMDEMIDAYNAEAELNRLLGSSGSSPESSASTPDR